LPSRRPTAYAALSPGSSTCSTCLAAARQRSPSAAIRSDRSRLTHTVRAVGNVTKALGDIRPPAHRAARPLRARLAPGGGRGRELLLIAGGIGLAPLRPVLYAAMAAPERYARITVLLGARSPGDLLFTEELLRWKFEHGLQLLASVDNATFDWRGDVGVITGLIPRVNMNPDKVLAMICGPEVMIRFCVKGLRARGVPGASIHVSLERNMKCALGICGHCQLGPHFLCRNGPVFRVS
jgi:NAD(P)H-flavin reductase